MVATVNLDIIQGATFTQEIYRKNKKTKQPIDLTDYTAKFEINTTYGGTAVLSLTTSNGGIAITAAAGKIVVTASATQTAALTFDTAYYNLELTTGAVVKTLLRGTITLIDDVAT